MKYSIFYFVSFCFSILFLNSFPAYSDLSPLSSPEDESVAIKRERFSIPILFEKNVGQLEERNEFVAGTSLFTAEFSAGEIRFVPRYGQTIQRADYRTTVIKQKLRADAVPSPSVARVEKLTLQLLGSDPSVELVGEQAMSIYTHYYSGAHTSNWRTGVQNYAAVRYRDLYRDSDLIFENTPNGLGFRFVIRPGGDPSLIEWKFVEHNQPVIGPDGHLSVSPVSSGFSFSKPKAYQETGSGKRLVEVSFDLRDDGVVGFVVGSYDPQLPLEIDPLVLVWGTSVTDGNNTQLLDVGVHQQSGAVTVVGVVGTDLDAGEGLVARYDAAGQIEWLTKYGGSEPTSLTIITAVDVDEDGNTIFAGRSNSDSLPVFGAVQASNNGQFDAFVARLDSDGDLLSSTYLGGARDDSISDLKVTATGDVIVTGYTESGNFPLAGAVGMYAGSRDAVLMKLNAELSQIVFSTYFGGDGVDEARSVDLDTEGGIYTTGLTNSGNFPLPDVSTTGAQSDLSSTDGSTDGFVVKFDPDGQAVLYSTYLGGSNGDVFDDISVSEDGSVYVAGGTFSDDFPVTTAIQRSQFEYNAPIGILARVSAGGDRILFASPVGNDFTNLQSVEVEGSRRVFLSGTTNANFPVDWPDNSLGSTDYRAFVAELDSGGHEIADLAFLGAQIFPPTQLGSNPEVNSMAVDLSRNMLFVVGRDLETYPPLPDGSVPFPTTFGALYAIEIVDMAAFEQAAKFVCGTPVNPSIASNWRINKGTYGTSINVKNPTGEPVEFDYSLSLTWPAPLEDGSVAPGAVLPGKSVTLEANEAILLDCVRIAREFQINAPFFEGFLTTAADTELVVTAVYSSGAEDLGGGGVAPVPGLDIERVPTLRRSTEFDISVYTEMPVQRRRECPSHAYDVETTIRNNGTSDVHNIRIRDLIASNDIDVGPDIHEETYSVSHQGTFNILTNNTDQMAEVEVEIPSLPGGQSATITRMFGARGEDDYLSIIVTVTPHDADQNTMNNSFRRTYWVPDCN